MILAITLLAFAAAIPQTREPNPCDNIIQNVWDPRFNPNERWSYRARPADKGSTITITKIDNVPSIGFVIHFKVDHVTFSYDTMRGNERTHHRGPDDQTLYLAMHRDSLDASAIQRVGIVPEPEPSSTYHKWLDSCDALSYKTTVADTIQKLQDAYWVKWCDDNKNAPWASDCQGVRSLSVQPSARTAPTHVLPSAPPTPSPTPGPSPTSPNTTTQP
jgi:hypothetical protein